MATHSEDMSKIPDADVPLSRDPFMRTLIRHLSGTLEEVVGLDEAAGFVSVVGQRMGEEINNSYHKALQEEDFDASEVTNILIDLKRRIEGDFYLIEQDEDKIVLGNRACPFGDKVVGRPSMCMMTSNVFGSIAAQNLGYAKVDVQETIAEGHPECRIVVHLKRTPESDSAQGREYYKS